jgi:hypothetical protein
VCVVHCASLAAAQRGLRRAEGGQAPSLWPSPCDAGVFVAAGPTVGALRVLRAVRIARAVRYARGLKRIATTLYITLPTLANAVLVFALFLFMFAVLGTQLFYGGRPGCVSPACMCACVNCACVCVHGCVCVGQGLVAGIWGASSTGWLLSEALPAGGLGVLSARLCLPATRPPCLCTAPLSCAGTLPNEDLLLDGQGFTTFFNWQNTGNALMMLTNAATGALVSCVWLKKGGSVCVWRGGGRACTDYLMFERPRGLCRCPHQACPLCCVRFAGACASQAWLGSCATRYWSCLFTRSLRL